MLNTCEVGGGCLEIGPSRRGRFARCARRHPATPPLLTLCLPPPLVQALPRPARASFTSTDACTPPQLRSDSHLRAGRARRTISTRDAHGPETQALGLMRRLLRLPCQRLRCVAISSRALSPREIGFSLFIRARKLILWPSSPRSAGRPPAPISSSHPLHRRVHQLLGQVQVWRAGGAQAVVRYAAVHPPQ